MTYRGGYYRYDKKETTNHYRQLDVRQLKRLGALKPGYDGVITWQSGNSISIIARRDCIKLSYNTLTDSYSYIVRLGWTECNYGGERVWFFCPVKDCGKRVAILYGGKIFGCRHCYNLAYDSQNESQSNRVFKKMIFDRVQNYSDFPL